MISCKLRSSGGPRFLCYKVVDFAVLQSGVTKSTLLCCIFQFLHQMLAMMRCIVLAAVFTTAVICKFSTAHLCLLSPVQRGSLVGINKPGKNIGTGNGCIYPNFWKENRKSLFRDHSSLSMTQLK